MKVLGISSDFHDSSASLLVNGEVRFSGAEERFSFQKHDSSFPSLAIDAALSSTQIAPQELDWIAYHEDPVMKFSRVLTSRLHSFPSGFPAFARSMRELILGQLWVKLDIFKKLGVSPKKMRYVPHHLSHAAYAFASSPFDSAAVLVLDAVGEWSCTTWFQARRINGKVELTPRGVVPYPHSLGMMYSAFTGFLGFRVNEGECSMMALAAFGKPRYADRVRLLLRAQSDGTYELDPGFFDFSDPERLPVSKKFLDLFGSPRFFRDPLPYSSLMSAEEHAAVPTALAYYADLAASVQLVLEETVLQLCAKVKTETGQTNLCLAGGVALNSTLNGKVIRKAGFSQVHIPPDPGDGGGALGAAIYLNSCVGHPTSASAFSAYNGLSYDEQGALELLNGLNQHELARHRSLPSELGAVSGLSVRRYSEEDFSALAEATCEDLKAGKVVGWLQGRFENGPRALGNRSILIDPRNDAAAKRLSRSVKARAGYRPYACSIAEEGLGKLFEAPSLGMRWMSSTHPVCTSGSDHIRHAMHFDGTTRPQLLAQRDNPRFHSLLRHWESGSESPALLNTSFNESGYPMVSSPTEALLMFLRTDMETLVLNNSIIRKKF